MKGLNPETLHKFVEIFQNEVSKIKYVCCATTCSI